MEQEKKSFFDLMSPKQTFIVGGVAGFLVLCAIGFFILLGLMFKGGLNFGGADSAAALDFEAPKKFSACLDEGQKATKVKTDAQLGASLGVSGTPATFANGYLISGALPYEMVKQVIDALLVGKEPNQMFDFMKDEKGNLVKRANMPELQDAIWVGDKDAKITLVEFADFECPYCSKFDSSVMQVLANYGDKVRYTFRHFPLSFHANAQKAGEAFECAKEQGKTWEMHDKLFRLSDTKTMSVENYKRAASELGLK
ncbi:MAG: thioredoxin domain-containing protein [Candidatus Magasanikbacteria bacterium]|nr:thioredoxin domain-containing protein [Candidatus Magasanikbacteria bacterium]